MDEDSFFDLLNRAVDEIGSQNAAAIAWDTDQSTICALLKRRGSVNGRPELRVTPAILNGMGYTKTKHLYYTYEKKP